MTAGTDISLTRLAGEWVPQTGASIVLHLAPWIQVGGVGHVSLEHPIVPDQNDVRVRFGYGGVRVAVRPLPDRVPALLVSLLGGAGNVDVQEPTLGSIVDSENGGVLEPAISLHHTLGHRFGVLASASWRFAFEFDAVVGVDSAGLGGPALSFGLTFGPF